MKSNVTSYILHCRDTFSLYGHVCSFLFFLLGGGGVGVVIKEVKDLVSMGGRVQATPPVWDLILEINRSSSLLRFLVPLKNVPLMTE